MTIPTDIIKRVAGVDPATRIDLAALADIEAAAVLTESDEEIAAEIVAEGKDLAQHDREVAKIFQDALAPFQPQYDRGWVGVCRKAGGQP